MSPRALAEWPQMSETGIVPISPLEIACGWPFGQFGADLPCHSTSSAAEAVATLERGILREAGDRQCFVSFSGGRDSSVVLAAVTRVARRQGLPDPIPVTDVYPGVSDAEESSWQVAVVRHLGLDDWIRRDATGDCELVGSHARRVLARWGVVWPPTLGANVGRWGLASGGVLFTGEGGDTIFGTHRVVALRRLPRNFPPGFHRLSAAGDALKPLAWRRRTTIRGVFSVYDWLQPEARVEVSRAIAEVEASEPLHAFRASMAERNTRAMAIGLHNMSIVANDIGTVLVHPLLDPEFLGALAPIVGRWGFPNRGAMMKALFEDLLPAAALERTTKAVFNQTNFGRVCRSFLETWDGSGIDVELVDTDRLRRAWALPSVHPATFMLLQQAWLTSNPPCVAS